MPIRSSLFYVLLSLTFLLSACKGGSKVNQEMKPEKTIDDSALSEAQKAAYQTDAARLTMRDISFNRLGQPKDANLPPDRVTSYYEKLVSIFLLQKEDARIPDLSNIHTYPSPDLNRIMVVLKKDCPWLAQWQESQAKTGNNELDKLVEKHKISVSPAPKSMLGPTFRIQTAIPVNTTFLANQLGNIEGVYLAEPDGAIGDGDDIKTALGDNQMQKIIFSKGWGDCPSGCIHHSNWEFGIGANGKVTFLGHTGENMPTNPEEE